MPRGPQGVRAGKARAGPGRSRAGSAKDGGGSAGECGILGTAPVWILTRFLVLVVQRHWQEWRPGQDKVLNNASEDSRVEPDMAAYDLPPSKEITCLTGDDPEQRSLLFQNTAEKLAFLACVSMQEFEKCRQISNEKHHHPKDLNLQLLEYLLKRLSAQ